MLGLREFESEYSKVAVNITYGVMSLVQFSALMSEDGLYLTLNKNCNKATKNSKINFCMDDIQRKLIIKYLIEGLKKFPEISVYDHKNYTIDGNYTLYIIINEDYKEDENYNFKNIIEFILESLIKGNENGWENVHLKDINNLLLSKTII